MVHSREEFNVPNPLRFDVIQSAFQTHRITNLTQTSVYPMEDASPPLALYPSFRDREDYGRS
jgi:hypothetical protein